MIRRLLSTAAVSLVAVLATTGVAYAQVSTTQHLPAAARNRGADASTGAFILFTDSDCVARNNWVSKMIQSFSDDNIEEPLPPAHIIVHFAGPSAAGPGKTKGGVR